MSHNLGTIQTVSPPFSIGPDTGALSSGPNTWSGEFAWVPAPSGTKYLILHFTNVDLPVGNRLEIDLGYETDVFTSVDGADFWTRPVNVYAFPSGTVPIRYITDGATNGIATIDTYGRGERLPGIQDPSALTNCDPFLDDPYYTEPIYDPFWYCSNPPNWENASCSSGDIREIVAPSVGIVLHVGTEIPEMNLSTCTVTLIGPDTVITAGHCMPNLDLVPSSSVIFGYRVNCDGSRPTTYSPIVCKVTSTIRQRYADGSSFDYWLMRIKIPSGGLGIPPIQLRHDLPLPGEQIFGLHHPNGAVQKLSIPHPGFDSVVSSGTYSITVPNDFAVSGGSSGSGLFDAAGRITGVLSNGNPCGHGGYTASLLSYCPTASIMADISPAPPTPITRDVMIVFDRSGSMSLNGSSGRPKIEEARDAAALFVQLVRAETGNRLGLVSFSTIASSPVDFPIAPVTASSQTDLVGPAPYVSGVIGGLTPGGSTTIGGGIDTARLQFPTPGTNPRNLLLLTDGFENTPPMISGVENDLGDISVDVIGYGTPANLNGGLLNSLATAHAGRYTQGDTSLQLEKFFSQAFGNIFEAGLLMDPEYDLPAGQDAKPIQFRVCGEEHVTVVLGWDNPGIFLRMHVKTPLGNMITGTTSGVQQQTGNTWTFMRIPLPQGSERDGTWQVDVLRPTGGGEFPPPTPALRFFVNIVASGGAIIRRKPDRVTYYTGDTYNPCVQLQFTKGGPVPNSTVQVSMTRPDASLGTILSKARLGAPATIDGDVIPARQATLGRLEAEHGSSLIGSSVITLDLDDSPANNDGIFIAAGDFGIVRNDLLTVDGEYGFQAKATYGKECTATREYLWGLHIEVGIDPDHTDMSVDQTGTNSTGDYIGTITIIPGDKYGNKLGPGRSEEITVSGVSGTTITGPVVDNGNGTYTIPVTWGHGTEPGVVIGQPGRSPVVVTPPQTGGHCHINLWWLILLLLLVMLAGILLGYLLWN